MSRIKGSLLKGTENMVDFFPKPASPPPLPRAVKSPPSTRPRISFILGTVSVVVGLAGLVYGLFYSYDIVTSYFDKYQAQQNNQRNYQVEAEIRLRIHNELVQKTDDISLKGTSLPMCPLIFPLLNEKKQITPLGSFLSVMAMEQATYLPHAVFQLTNEFENFEYFHLFENPNPFQQGYLTQLPCSFGTKDFGEGTLIHQKKKYRVQLHFHGTHPEKTYQHRFTDGELHLIIGWIASQLQDYMGFQPSDKEKGFMENPIFTADQALTLAASQQFLIQSGGAALVTHWDVIKANTSDFPDFYAQYIGILDAQEGGDHLDLTFPLLEKYPDSDSLNNMKLSYDYSHEKYDEMLKRSWPLLKRDDNNKLWYEWTADAMEYKEFWSEANQLMKMWTQIHPDNPEAWLELAQNFEAWSGREEWANSDDPNTVRLFKERIQEALNCAQKASQMAPGNAKVWTTLETIGRLMKQDRTTMDGYFQKAIALYPSDYEAYNQYIKYLKSIKPDGDQQALAFARKYSEGFPDLLAEYCAGEFIVPATDDSIQAKKNQIDQERLKVQKSPEWPDFENSVKAFLKQSPAYMAEWKSYLQWADLKGDVEPVFRFAQECSNENPELKSLYPNVLLAYPDTANLNRITEEEKTNFSNLPSTVKITGEALNALVVLNPDNWYYLNRLAKYDLKNAQFNEAKNVFLQIGEHWSSDVWTKDEFEKGKALASSPQPK